MCEQVKDLADVPRQAALPGSGIARDRGEDDTIGLLVINKVVELHEICHAIGRGRGAPNFPAVAPTAVAAVRKSSASTVRTACTLNCQLALFVHVPRATSATVLSWPSPPRTIEITSIAAVRSIKP